MRLGHLIDLNGEAGRFSEGLAGLDRCKRHQMANGMDRGWGKTTSYLDWLVRYGVQQLFCCCPNGTGPESLQVRLVWIVDTTLCPASVSRVWWASRNI